MSHISVCLRRTLLITVFTMQLVRHEEMVQQLSSYQSEDFDHDIALPAHHKVITAVCLLAPRPAIA